MTLSDISIKRPVFAWMIMFALIIFGAISLGRLGVSQMPDVDFPQLNITTRWEGAAPEVMETEIVDKIESQLISVEGLQDITSTIRQGTSDVTLSFDINQDVDSALQEVQSKISSIRFPQNVDLPTISKSNPDDNPILWLGISSTRSLHDLIVYIDLHLRDQFQVLPGVGELYLSGFSDRNLRIWFDNKKLQEYELTVLDVKQAIELEHIETAAGYMDNPKKEMNLRVMGEARTPEDVGEILITQRGGRPIYNPSIRVKDVARVEDDLNDIRRITRISSQPGVLGKPGVGIGIKKQRGANAVNVAKAVKQKIEDLKKILPEDITVSLNFDSTKFIEESVRETEFTLILSALATALVCWIFLGSWSSTVNVLLSIPTSIVGTFIVIYFMGFTLNFFTILGLALAVGIVVDDAIMVLENIVRHQQLGKDRVHAALDGAREITFAAIAATIAVVAIFLPVAFMSGILGKFFFQFGVTISAAVLLSLLEAVTLTPMRCSQFLESGERLGRMGRFMERIFHILSQIYRDVLSFTLSFRLLILVVSFLFFGLSLISVKYLSQELIPPQDMDTFIIRYETPVGSSIEFTSDRVQEAEKILIKHDEITRYFAAVGGFAGGEVNTGINFITLKPKSERKKGQFEIMGQLRKEISQIPGFTRVVPVDISSRGFSAQRGGGFPIDFNIRGSQYEILKEKVKLIMDKLQQTGLVKDINTDYREGMPEVQIWPDRKKAAESGVSMESIGETIQTAIGGIREGRFTNGGRRYDVRLRLETDERQQAEDIGNLQIRTRHGELILLKNLAKIEVAPTLLTITRRMRERSISVTANLTPGKSQSEALEAARSICKEVLPEGYRMFLSGNAQTFQESMGGFIFAFGLGLLVAYMVLASQFNSFLHPFTILLALPFSLSGAFLALLFCQQTLNLYSGIGIILLMGIVKKNSILLVEFTNKMRFEKGLPLKEAILTAGPVRLRPILMTSFATIAASIPPALAIGPGAESRVPMAIAVIGGVMVSTFLTLIVVPCAYSLLARFERSKYIPDHTS